MNTTWLLISDKERAAAVALDYEAFENFWPTADFTSVRFNEKVTNWAGHFASSNSVVS